MPAVTLQDVKKTYPNGMRAIKNFSLTIEQGEFISLLGPSGCGKTTTLRCIAGLETPDSGTIQLADQTVFQGSASKSLNVPTERRGLSMVFQQYALWPHMTVLENVAFPLKSRKLPKADVAAKAERALRSVRLWELRDRQITQLSGGQQQRIALARAVAPDPNVVLFDEPLSNLDVKLRDSMRIEIMELQQRMGLTAVYVTHDQDEAFSLSSRIVVMSQGSVEQVGTPADVWESPASPFVAEFVGTSTRVEGRLMNEARLSAGDTGRFMSDDGFEVHFVATKELPAKGNAVAFLRSGEIKLTQETPVTSRRNVWEANLELQSFHGDYAFAYVRLHGRRVACRLDRPLVGVGHSDRLYASIEPDRVVVFDDPMNSDG